MYVLHIYLFHYAQHVVYLFYCIITHFFKLVRMEPRYPMLEEEYNKDHRSRYIEEGRVTRIIIFCTLILVREVCKTNKHFCMSLVGSFDPLYQGPQQVHGGDF
jgi:hypothetical protein